MYIIAIAWVFVVVLMAAAEAMSTSVVGGIMTFLLYCALPLGLFLYIFGTPQRRRNQRMDDTHAEDATAATDAADEPGPDQTP